MIVSLAVVCSAALALVPAPRAGRARRILLGREHQQRRGIAALLPRRLAALRGFIPGGGSATRDALDLWPGAVHRMVALLRSGSDPAAVWQALGAWATGEEDGVDRRAWQATPGRDLRKALHAAGAAVVNGGDAVAALREAPLEHPRSREARNILVAAWQVSATTGAPLTEVLTRLARGIEDALDAADARESAIAGPKATGRLLTALPFLGLGLGMLMGTDPIGTLLGTGWGRVALAVGAALSLAGVLWSRRLIRAAQGDEG